MSKPVPREKKKLPPIYELAWNHTTLRAIKVDPAMTYLQVGYGPDDPCGLVDRVRRKFPEALQGKRVITLGIPDDYDFMQPELIDELRGKLGPYVTLDLVITDDETDAAAPLDTSFRPLPGADLGRGSGRDRDLV